MTAFTDAVLATSPAFYYPMDEPSGNFVDRVATPLNLDTFGAGSITRGEASLLPGEPTGAAVSQDKDTWIASRAHDATQDVPGTFNKFALGCWAKTSKVKAQHPLIRKHNSYALTVFTNNKLTFGIQGETDLESPADLVVPGNSFFAVAVLDAPNATQQLYMNGGLVATRVVSTGLTVPTSANQFRVGGLAAVDFVDLGMSGTIQHVMVWQTTIPTEAQVRSLYELGVTDEAEVAGEAANVMPWSTQILAANANRKQVWLSNDSDSPIYVTLGATAAVGAGIRIEPEGFRLMKGYTGVLSAIHRIGPYGVKRLAIQEQ